MQKIVMPEMPDFSKMRIGSLIAIKCDAVYKSGACYKNGSHSCVECAVYSIGNYKKWESQQPKETNLVKWPISSKERFFVFPRVFVNAMPNKWQKRFLSLMNEYNKKYSTYNSEIKFRISATRRGKYIPMPKIFK